jgi:hypothetical protein
LRIFIYLFLLKIIGVCTACNKEEVSDNGKCITLTDLKEKVKAFNFKDKKMAADKIGENFKLLVASRRKGKAPSRPTKKTRCGENNLCSAQGKCIDNKKCECNATFAGIKLLIYII